MATNPHYLRQEEYLRYVLQRFTAHLGSAKVLGEETTAKLIDAFIAKQPRSTVALIQNDKGEILSVSRPHQPGNLGLPGGKIDAGETPEQAVVREVSEETGIEALDPVFCFERIDFSDGRISWCYRVTKWTGEPRKCEDGIEVQWVAPARLLDPSCTFRDYNRALFEAVGMTV